MSAREITSAVIREFEDDGHSAKYLVVAPEERIVWVTTTRDGERPDLSPEERKRAVTQAGIRSLLSKLKREEQAARDEADILDLSDEQIDCRDRNGGRCSRYPRSVNHGTDQPDGASESGDDEECRPGVLECWMLEDDMD
jgi:hypothetical protein